MLLILMVTIGSSKCFAGAWTQAKGAVYNKMAVDYYDSEKFYVDDSDRMKYPDHGDFEEYNGNYYGEYGVTDQLTVLGSLYYKYLHKEDDLVDMTTSGVGDVDAAAKHNLMNNNFGVFSVQGLVKIPEFYDKNDAPPLGNGQWDYELRLLYGHSLWPLIPGYCNAEAAYRWRTDKPSDEFRFLAEIGSDFSKSFYGRVKLDGILSMNLKGNAQNIADNPTTSDSYDLIKLDMAAGYHLTKNWSMEFAYTPSIYGQWTAVGATYTAALVFEAK